MSVVDTYFVRIYMAGPIERAKDVIRRECYYYGLCVTIEPTTFIYTGGEEAGVVIGFVNYPRFPSTPAEIFRRAEELAGKLIPEMNQKSALLVGADKTKWIKLTPPGATEKDA